MSQLLPRLKLTGAFLGGAVSCYLGQEARGTGLSMEEVKGSLEKITSKLREGVMMEKRCITFHVEIKIDKVVS